MLKGPFRLCLALIHTNPSSGQLIDWRDPDQCPLCDQEDENIQHLLIGCVFAKQFWLVILHNFGLAALAPQPSDSSFDVWWDKTILMVNGDVKRGLNSLIILGAWTIWKHRNDCVFNGATPNLITALTLAWEEAMLWSWPRGCPGTQLRRIDKGSLVVRSFS